MHTAPGHGQEDYLTGLKYGLPLLSPVNDMGCFTEEAGERFVGKDVLGDGNTDVIAALGEAGVLIKEEVSDHCVEVHYSFCVLFDMNFVCCYS